MLTLRHSHELNERISVNSKQKRSRRKNKEDKDKIDEEASFRRQLP